MPETKPAGRPPLYAQTPELAIRVCELIADGYTLKQIGAMEGIPAKRYINEWRQSDPVFAAMYTRARELRADHYADEIIEIADDSSNDWMEREGIEVPNQEVIARTRVRVDTRKWLMSKMNKDYADKLDIKHAVTVTHEQLVLQVIEARAAKVLEHEAPTGSTGAREGNEPE